MNDFLTINSASWTETDGKIIITALPKTDLFINPVDGVSVSNAQFVYKMIEGDFVMHAKVSHAFSSTYDACVLLAWDSETKWAKACFEYTDFGTKAVVSVMTNGKSDDANGVDIDSNSVWLRLSRKGDVFAVHYSLDGLKFYMSRLCSIPMERKIKVGMVAQSPLGDGGERIFEDFSLENKTLSDIRISE